MDKDTKEFADIYDHLSEKWKELRAGQFNLDNLNIIFKDVMEAVEVASEEWDGERKRKVAHQLVDHFIEDLKKSKVISETVAMNLKLASSLLSNTIFTVAVMASKNGIGINNSDGGNSCCAKCLIF